MKTGRHVGRLVAGLGILLVAGCGGDPAPMSPTPPADPVTANAYILPGGASLGATAFGDEPIVIHRGERLRWRNADAESHDVVADTPSLPEFTRTGVLAPGGEQSFIMNTAGTTKIHCNIHPEMTGTLVVQ
jgi:plastocyanin